MVALMVAWMADAKAGRKVSSSVAKWASFVVGEMVGS